jgi:hypothetical protein
MLNKEKQSLKKAVITSQECFLQQLTVLNCFFFFASNLTVLKEAVMAYLGSTIISRNLNARLTVFCVAS